MPNEIFIIEGRYDYDGEQDWWPYLEGPFLNIEHAMPALEKVKKRNNGAEYRISRYISA